MYSKKYIINSLLFLSVTFACCYCMEECPGEASNLGGFVRTQRRNSAPSMLGSGSSSLQTRSASALPGLRSSIPRVVKGATLFCDLRGFSIICDHHRQDPMVPFGELNVYHGEFRRIIQLFRGKVINTYGDAVYAFFQVDEDEEADTELDVSAGVEREHLSCCSALIAAHAMLGAIQQINHIRVSKELTPFCFGIGIDFGQMCESRAEGCTNHVGNPANIAQRLEDLNKDKTIKVRLGCVDPELPFSSIIISGTVYDLLPNELRYVFGERTNVFHKDQLRLLGMCELRGISEQVKAYGIGMG